MRSILLAPIAVILPVVILCSSGCASYEGWSAVKTKHITLYTDGTGQYQDTLRALENGYAGLASLPPPFFKGTPIGEIEVLFLDDPDFESLFGTLRTGAAIAAVPGKGKIGKNGLLVVRPHKFGEMHETNRADLNLDADLKKVGDTSSNKSGRAATEMLAHIFIQRRYPKAPLWFHEGFATYLNNTEIKVSGDGQVLACFGFLQKTEPFLGLDPTWDMTFNGYEKPEVRGWFHSTAYVFIDYILHGDGNQHRGLIGPIIQSIDSGDPSAKLIASVFPGVAAKDLEASVKSHRELMEQSLAANPKVRGDCPLGARIDDALKPEDVIHTEKKDVDAADMEALFRALQALPAREEYPPYYPRELTESVRVPAAAN